MQTFFRSAVTQEQECKNHRYRQTTDPRESCQWVTVGVIINLRALFHGCFNLLLLAPSGHPCCVVSGSHITAYVVFEVDQSCADCLRRSLRAPVDSFLPVTDHQHFPHSWRALINDVTIRLCQLCGAASIAELQLLDPEEIWREIAFHFDMFNFMPPPTTKIESIMLSGCPWAVRQSVVG